MRAGPGPAASAATALSTTAWAATALSTTALATALAAATLSGSVLIRTAPDAPVSSTPSLSCCSGVYTAAAKPLTVRLAPCGGSSSPRAHAGPAAVQSTPAGAKMPSLPAALGLGLG